MAAEGTPASLKAEVGVPRLEVAIARGDIARAEEVLGRHGELLPTRAGTVMITLPGGASEVAGLVRALDDAGLPVESLDVVQPTLDDVFVVKTGRSLEGAGAAQAPGAGEATPA
jgi:ABC-2 type transport system ATP-binding protein